MTARTHLEDPLALVVAIALHAGLLAVLVMHPAGRAPPPPPRMEVSLADDVGLHETAPATSEPAAADIAPKLGTAPPPPPPPAPPPPQQVLPKPQPRPVPQPIAAPKPLPQPKPVPPKPAPPKPAPPKPAPPRPMPPRPIPRPDPIAALTAAAEAQAKAKAQARARAQARDEAKLADAAPQDTPRKAGKTVGGSRIGADFLAGVTSANTSGHSKAAPSPTPGPAVQAALAGVISRQLKANWIAPQGADADKLVTYLTWNLNPDGTLDGPPRLVRQEGVNDSNRPQAARHVEQAIRAVELAEPFQLPPEFYPTWKHVASFRFDRKLSQ